MGCRLAISYHTETDDTYAEALARELEREGASVSRLAYLTLSGFSLPDGPGGGQLRKEGWIEHFADILDGCVGMVVIRSEAGKVSEKTSGRGMWIEQRLVDRLHSAPKDFVYFVDAPHQVTPDAGLWASEQSNQLIPWLKQREQSGAPGLARYRSEDVNVQQQFTNHEIAFAHSERSWFSISVLDLYDRVWHCKWCLATSDVWIGIDSRPPVRCPSCGYAGQP